MKKWIALTIICFVSIYVFYIVQYEVYHTNYFDPLLPTFTEKYLMLPFVQIVLQIVLVGLILLASKGIRQLLRIERGSKVEMLLILLTVGTGLCFNVHIVLQEYELLSMLSMVVAFILLGFNSVFFQLNSKRGESVEKS